MKSNNEVFGILEDTQAYLKTKIAELATADAPAGLINDFSQFCSALEKGETALKFLDEVEKSGRSSPSKVMEMLEQMMKGDKFKN